MNNNISPLGAIFDKQITVTFDHNRSMFVIITHKYNQEKPFLINDINNLAIFINDTLVLTKNSKFELFRLDYSFPNLILTKNEFAKNLQNKDEIHNIILYFLSLIKSAYHF